jgi:toxin ParE1/3/4
MKWKLRFHPQVEWDVAEAATWYESREPGLGTAFVDEVFRAWDTLVDNPFLNSRRHPSLNIRWRFTDRFPYRIVYEVLDLAQTVVIAAVVHAARYDRHWRRRV